MKTPMISVNGLFWIFTLVFKASLGYHILLSDIQSSSDVVFDSSLNLDGCQYHVQHEACEGVPFHLNLDQFTGLLTATLSHLENGRIDNTCFITIAISDCNGFGKVTYPLYISYSSYDPTKVISQLPMNVSFHGSMHSKGDDVTLSQEHIINITPKSIRSKRCKLDTTPTSRHRIPTDSIRNTGRALQHKYDMQKISFVQYITDCTASEPEDVVIPNQEIVLIINSGHEITHKSARHTLKTLRRHRRGSGGLYFSPTIQSADIFENLPPNTEVITLKVTNPRRVSVKYSLQAKSDVRSLNAFQINAITGVVTTRRQLDRETVPFHELRVTATGPGGASTSGILNINVLDINDNDPTFEKSDYHFDISEDVDRNAYVGKVTASDADSGRNQRLMYSIENLTPTNRFSINSNGEIILRTKVDREEREVYRFQVVATDGGTSPRRATASVTVTVEDINDMAPVFTKSQYQARIPENTAVNSEIIQVNATDGDAGLNGKVVYSFRYRRDRNYFEIGRTSGKISLISEINFADYPDGYKILVRAQDQGTPPKSAFCEVIVSIVDVNDNTPTFWTSIYERVVSENFPVKNVVLEVKATDADDGENARISYSFVAPPANLPFRIDAATGKIILKTPLDFEEQNVYVLNVKATDHGHEAKHSVASVEIKVRDINDNVPKFTKSKYFRRVPETADIGHVIISVEAEDLDKDSTLDYSITGGNYGDKFRITTRDNQGIITLSRRLNFNERHSYVLTVRCSDGELYGYTKVTINVSDANTHPPEFDKEIYEVDDVKEDVSVGTVIVKVHATDEDVGENSKITYQLQDDSDKFDLNATSGEIKTKAELDFDVQSQLSLMVIARDQGEEPQEAQAEVVIYLRDVNDNAPVFDKTVYTATIEENVRIGSYVDRVHAFDKDSGKNGQIFYTFNDGGDDGNGYFSVDQNGVIRTAAKLDREHIAEYTLVVYAEDRGDPAQRTPVHVRVVVKDVDDNPPIFPKDILVFNVSEDKPPMSVIATLVAVDPDEGKQYQINYALQEAGDLWDLNVSTGELRPRFQLDFEEKSSYTLTVRAKSGQLLSQATVIINLIDVNDNPPELNPFQVVFNNYRTDKPYAFPIGPIGKVPAHDADVTSVLKYSFAPGSNNSLLILNATSGELRLSAQLDNDREFAATFLVQVSDGKHNVTAECLLKVVPITDEMLINSVTVRVERMSQEDFLSTAMKQFIYGLSQILDTSTQHVYIFNVQNDTDVLPHSVVNVSFSAKRADGQYLSTQQLQEQVYLNRSVLTNYSMQRVMPFDDNICLREPCQNYMRCVSALYFNSSAPFVSTDTILFRPIHPVSGLRCKCPTGFTGDDCQNEVNMCHASKCKNGGKCVSVEGGYVCQCGKRFAGRHCEVDLSGDRCSGADGVCKNDATCRDYPAGGLECDCKASGLAQDEVSRFCELRGRSFQKGDYVMFSGISRQWRFTLQLSFATREKDGMLLYNGRFNHEHDYFALEIVGGQVQLNFSTGGEHTIVSPYVDGGVSDGEWHTVEVRYRNKPKSEVLGKHYPGPSNIKIVTVTVDPDSCDPAILDRWTKNLGNYTCTQKAEQGGSKMSLDLTTPLLVGGVLNLPEQYQVKSRHFSGCIRDLYLDREMVDMSLYVANYGSQPGCQAMRDHCTNNPCSRGICESVWNTYKCNCERDYGGRNCEKFQISHRFAGSGSLKMSSVANAPRPASYQWKHSVSFRTTHENGMILDMYIGRDNDIKLKLQDGRLLYLVHSGKQRKYTGVDKVLNDGAWHDVTVEWMKIREKPYFSIIIDEELSKGPVSASPLEDWNSAHRFTGVYLGNVRNSRAVGDGFVGCLRGLRLESSGVSGSSWKESGSSWVRTPASARITNGCNAPNPCSGVNCPLNSDCIALFDTYQCKCRNGYVGDKCVNVCTLNPCRNSGACVLDQNEMYGYRCRCSEKYYGSACENEYQFPCISGWWAGEDRICTPCNCRVDKNFDHDCGSHGGKCVCKRYHYYSSEKGACLPCGCYSAGSLSFDCEEETGQCECKSSVIGKKCDQCSSNFAKILDDGCNIHYGSCPHVNADNVWWRQTEFGKTVLEKCPKGSEGLARRDCINEQEGWLLPDLSNCTSTPYHDLNKDLNILIVKNKYFEEHRVRMSMDVVTRLYAASNSTDDLHEGDIRMSYDLIMTILKSQISLSGFDLTASRRKDFNKYLIDSTSHALADNNLIKWKSIQNDWKYRMNSARLVESYEGYLDAMTRSMRVILVDSVWEDARNMDMRVASISNKEDVVLNMDGNDHGVVVKMHAVEESEKNKQQENGTIGVIEYATIGKLLPLSYHDSRLDMKRPLKGFVNSYVVSVAVHDRPSRARPGRNLISLTFPLLRNSGNSPQCVFWNFTNRSDTPYGGWSQKGCERDFANKTHVTCTCSHLTTFAVLADEEVVSVLNELPVKIVLYGSVAIIIICILVCIGCTLFLQDVTSNHSKIHCNFGVSVLVSELFFSCGIMATANAYACMASAIFIHFFFMTTLAWVFVEGLHLYRMLTEKRDVDRGNMRMYYLIGWGVPGIITALSVGLDAKGFGNANFCWIRTDHLLVWSFAGPLLFCTIVYLVIFVLSLGKYCASKLPDAKLCDMRSKLRSSFILLPNVCALWGMALFAVNENKSEYYYIFSIINITLGILLLLLHCVFNKEVRSAIRSVKERRWQKAELTITKQHLLKSSFSATPDTSGPRRVNMGTSASSTSTNHTPSRKIHQNSTLFHDAALSDESESDDSESSIGSLASTHSSDEEVDSKPMYLNVNNSNSWQYRNGHLPLRRPPNGGLVVHSTPKDPNDDEQSSSFTNGMPSRSDIFVTSLPTVSESNLEEEEEEEHVEEPHYLAINSTRKGDKKRKEENIELLPVQDSDSLPRKGILKNGRKVKPPTPVRSDSLLRKPSPVNSNGVDTDETALTQKSDLIDKMEKVAVLQSTSVPSAYDQLL